MKPKNLKWDTWYVIYIALMVLCLMHCGVSKKSLVIKEAELKTTTIQETSIDTAGKFAKIVFDSTSYHFGSVRQGQLLNREIYFTNEGPGDLIISLMTACECTTLDWSRLPIKPGSKSWIKIIYNSKDKEGPQIVDIDITANTDPGSTFTKFSLFVEK
jgi:hypothetical protein